MRLLAFLLFSSLLIAQTPQADPDQFQIKLGLVQSRIYQQHERIPIEVQTTAPPFNQNQPPARQMWEFAGFRLDPQVDCGSDTNRCTERGLGRRPIGGVMSGNGLQVSVSHGPNTRKTILNYFMDLPPGQYHISAVVQKLILTPQPSGSTYAAPANPPEYIVSNPIDVTIQPASPQWTSQAIADSIAVLRKSPDGEDGRAAAQQLALLEGPGEWSAALDVLPSGENILLQQFRSTDQPEPLCDLMQSRLALPQQSVSSFYLSVMLDVCTQAHGPPPPPAPAPAAVKSVQISATPFAPTTPAPLSPETQQYLEKYTRYRADLLSKSTATLAAILPQKPLDAKLVAMTALIEQARQLQYNRPPGPTPTWTPIVTQEFIRLIPTLPDMRRRSVITLYASTIRAPEVARTLEAVIDEWKPGTYFEGPREALAALNRVDPKRAQARILAELKKEKPFLDAASLNLLPAKEVAPMDDELIAALEVAQKSGYWDPAIQLTAIAKYGTADALPRFRKFYESQQNPCQPELVAYFLRFDADYAARILQASPAKCAQSYFARTAPLITHPIFDAYVAPFMMNADVPVKAEAARTLGKYGSDAALKPLWDAYRYFYNYWDGKRADLEKGIGVNLETELRSAIARGQNWFTSEADLKTLDSLCVSGRCIGDARQDLDYWKRPLEIEVQEQGATLSARIAHYYAIDTIEKLEQKIAQFPQGTEFKLFVMGPDKAKLTEQITDAARRAGLSIVTQ